MVSTLENYTTKPSKQHYKENKTDADGERNRLEIVEKNNNFDDQTPGKSVCRRNSFSKGVRVAVVAAAAMVKMVSMAAVLDRFAER